MIYIRKYQNSNSKMPKAYGKWYGRIVHTETLNLDDLCEHIASHGTIFTADVVAGTVKKFVQCIQELLLEGKKVLGQTQRATVLNAYGHSHARPHALNSVNCVKSPLKRLGG